jgi:hypothetical protein
MTKDIQENKNMPCTVQKFLLIFSNLIMQNVRSIGSAVAEMNCDGQMELMIVSQI